MDIINQFIETFTEYPKIPLLIILSLTYLKWRGGALFMLTSGGRRLLNIEKELKKKFELKRSLNLGNLLDTTSNEIVVIGTFRGKNVRITLINSHLFKDHKSVLNSEISSLMKGASVIVESKNIKLEFSSDSLTFKDVTDLLEKL
jgi:hypothetical protein